MAGSLSAPMSVLSHPRQCTEHAIAAGKALSTTSLAAVVHARRACASARSPRTWPSRGLLSPPARRQPIIYHALALGEAGPGALLAAEAPRSPRWRGSLSGSASRSRSRNWRRCSQVGDPLGDPAHAPRAPAASTRRRSPSARSWPRARGRRHRHTGLGALCAPVVEAQRLSPARQSRRPATARGRAGRRPARLDLHLPPGRGTLPWDGWRRLAASGRRWCSRSIRHRAPVGEPPPLRRGAADALALPS